MTYSIYTSLVLLCHKKHSGTTKQLSSSHRMWHKMWSITYFFCSFWQWWERKNSYSARKTSSMEYPGMECFCFFSSFWEFFDSILTHNMLGPVPTAGFVAPLSGISCSNHSEHIMFPFKHINMIFIKHFNSCGASKYYGSRHVGHL